MNYAFPMISSLKIVDQVERYSPPSEHICVRRFSTFLISLWIAVLSMYNFRDYSIIFVFGGRELSINLGEYFSQSLETIANSRWKIFSYF